MTIHLSLLPPPPVIKLFDVASIEPFNPVGYVDDNGTISVYSNGEVKGNLSVHHIPNSYTKGAAVTITIANVSCTFPSGFKIIVTDRIGPEFDLLNIEYTKSDPNGSYDGLTGMADTTSFLTNSPNDNFALFFIITYKDGENTKTLNSNSVFLYKRDYSAGAN